MGTCREYLRAFSSRCHISASLASQGLAEVLCVAVSLSVAIVDFASVSAHFSSVSASFHSVNVDFVSVNVSFP